MESQLPNLTYNYDALEPHIDTRTMEVHHDKHHASYFDKLNTALSDHPEIKEKDIKDILADLESIPEEIRTAVKNNGGGHAHHTFFWNILSPDGGGEPSGDLAEAISQTYRDYDNFKEQFSEQAKTLFGSGWTWLVINSSGELEIINTPNQDSPFSHKQTPIIGLDVWEHAYYLKYENRRPEYIAAFWNIVNWPEADKIYESAK
jgi:Fe-Mn family superoxide dismutase